MKMCTICRHPDRIAIEAALQAGRPLRAFAADRGLNKSSLGRHRKDCMRSAPAASPPVTAERVGEGQATPQIAPSVRRRTRPLDEAQRLDIALRMKARGSTRADIAHALGVHPSTVGDIIRRATENAVERVRSDTVEELVAEHRAERHARVQALHAVLSGATLRNDVRNMVDVIRELRHEAKEDREWMRELGAFDRFRTQAVAERRKSDGPSTDIITMFEELFGALSSPDPIGALEELSRDPAGTTH